MHPALPAGRIAPIAGCDLASDAGGMVERTLASLSYRQEHAPLARRCPGRTILGRAGAPAAVANRAARTEVPAGCVPRGYLRSTTRHSPRGAKARHSARRRPRLTSSRSEALGRGQLSRSEKGKTAL